MSQLTAEVNFGTATLAKLESEGNGSLHPSQPLSFVGASQQARIFFNMAALPQAFTDALDAAEAVVKEQAAKRGVTGFLADCFAVAGAAMGNGQHILVLMEDSKPVEGYSDTVVTVKRLSP